MKVSPPRMYQAETYRLGTLARSSGRTNWAPARSIPSVAAPSTGSGNSAHSSGWLTPAWTSAQPGRTSSPFQTANSAQPSRTLVTGRAASRGTTK